MLSLSVFSVVSVVKFFSNTTVGDSMDEIPVVVPLAEKPGKEAVKAPPAGRKFPCPSCGARLDYNPAVRGLNCPYCGHEEKIVAATTAEILEHDYLEYLDKEEAKGKILPGHGSETKCPGCGAVVLLDDKLATERCPFCDTHLETDRPKDAVPMIPPESVAPFSIDLRTARDEFTAWLASLWFAPTELKSAAALGKFTGVYLPYWTYDAMTYTNYEGERGDDYTDTEYYTVTNSDGRSERRSRTVVRTNWTDVSGQVDTFFDDVLIPASKSLTDERLAGLGGWKLSRLAPFDAAYLAGFQTERYAVGLKDGLKSAKGIMDRGIVALVRQDIGGDHQRIRDKRTRYSGITFKLLLLPAWIAVYRYRGDVYQITVNGQTGTVSGRRPYSWSKIAGVVLAVLLVVALLIVGILLIRG